MGDLSHFIIFVYVVAKEGMTLPYIGIYGRL